MGVIIIGIISLLPNLIVGTFDMTGCRPDSIGGDMTLMAFPV
jgi:hypothetical protein